MIKMGHGEEQDCACGCGKELTDRQLRRKTRYASLSCARKAYMNSDAGKAVARRTIMSATEANRRKFFARVRVEILEECRDVLNGAEPSREMLIVAARMRAKGYHNGCTRRQWQMRKTA